MTGLISMVAISPSRTSEHAVAAECGDLQRLARRHPLVGAERMRLREEEEFARVFGWEQAHLQACEQFLL